MKISKHKTSKTQPASTRGSLLVITLLLVGSAVIRIGIGADHAMALASQTGHSSAAGQPIKSAKCETAENYQKLVDAIQARQSKLEEQEAALRDRRHALSIADREVTKKLAELKTAEASLRDTLALADSAAEDDLARLTKVYENMKPRQAASLFEEMDPSFAAGFLARMRPETAAAIMTGLSPQAAQLFSVVLAGRNLEVPKQ